MRAVVTSNHKNVVLAHRDLVTTRGLPLPVDLLVLSQRFI